MSSTATITKPRSKKSQKANSMGSESIKNLTDKISVSSEFKDFLSRVEPYSNIYRTISTPKLESITPEAVKPPIKASEKSQLILNI